MITDNYEKIIKAFGIESFYSKQQIINGLKKTGIIKNDKGLLNKIKNEFTLRKTYSHENYELKFIYLKNRKAYRVVTFPKSP